MDQDGVHTEYISDSGWIRMVWTGYMDFWTRLKTAKKREWIRCRVVSNSDVLAKIFGADFRLVIVNYVKNRRDQTQ